MWFEKNHDNICEDISLITKYKQNKCGNACISKREMDSFEYNDRHEVWKSLKMGQE
jgi:hypothetical protein